MNISMEYEASALNESSCTTAESNTSDAQTNQYINAALLELVSDLRRALIQKRQIFNVRQVTEA